jgi:TIR domain-containing protein/HEAT repeat protein
MPDGPKGKIFINYRRDDSADAAGRLYDRLEQEFGKYSLFMDVETMRAGADFVTTLEQQVAACDLLVVVIGKSWLDFRDSHGGRRLDNPNDFVRIEITSALRFRKRIVPVLVNQARMPSEDALPETLKPLSRLHGYRLTHERFNADCQGLISALNEQLTAARTGDEALVERISRALLNLRAPEATFRKSAAEALGKIGTPAAEHIPALANLLKESDREVRRAARDALKKMGPAGVPALADGINWLADAIINGTIWGMGRWEAIDELAERPVTAKSVEALFVITRDPEKYAEIAFHVIASLGKDAARVIPTLMAFLGDDDIAISIAAARAITGAGPAAIPALEAALNSPDYKVSYRAETILAHIAAENKSS